jgi:hypothetical protein
MPVDKAQFFVNILTMKAILIDATNHVIKQIELSSDYRDIQKAIGCSCFTIAHHFEKLDALYVDDEGLLVDEVKTGFTCDGQFLAGNGVVVGGLPDGDSTDVKISIADLSKHIKFMPHGHILNPAVQDEMCKWTITAVDNLAGL